MRPRVRSLGLLAALAVCLGLVPVGAEAEGWGFPVPWESEGQKEIPKPPGPPSDQLPPVREKAPPPPAVRPYKIPRFGGDRKDDFHYVPPIKLSKIIDADAVFQAVINCFPERPKWGIEVKAVAGARYTEQGQVSTFDTAGLSRYYAGIVAEMPIYSAEEVHRQRTQEYQRRSEVAANVAALLKGLADRDRALRLIGIHESMEARSQYRVYEGIAGAEEQAALIEKVAGSVSDLNAANAAVIAARLALVGQCRDEVAGEVNAYLMSVTR